jgi:hypothetical protein
MTNWKGQSVQWPIERDSQYNDQLKRTVSAMTKTATNYLQNTTQQTKDWTRYRIDICKYMNISVIFQWFFIRLAPNCDPYQYETI